MNKFKNPQLALLLALSLLVVILFALTQSAFLNKYPEPEPSKIPQQQVQLPKPTGVVIVDPASAWGL